jgi:hypothetical protein
MCSDKEMYITRDSPRGELDLKSIYAYLYRHHDFLEK